jgi:hypothetical protein
MKVGNRAGRVTAALLVLAGVGLGCSFGTIYWGDPLKRQVSLQEAQKRYTILVRWSEFDKASAFVDPELREAYRQNAPSLRELRFTDYESEPSEIDEETGTATIEVTYYAYTPSSPIEISIREIQEWYRANLSNHWLVRPRFEGLNKLVSSRPGR